MQPQLKRTTAIMLALLVLCCLLPAALVLAAEISDQNKTLLLNSGIPEYELVPQDWNISHIRHGVARVEPTESLEALFLLPWPEGTPTDPQERMQLVRRSLRRISGMTGLKYPPASKKAGQTLYYDVHVVASPDNLQRLPDPPIETINESMELFVKTLNDEKKEVVMNILVNQGDRISLQLKNATPLKLGFITVVHTERMGFLLDIAPREDGVQIYGVGAIKTFDIGLLRPLVRERLRDNTEAIVSWVADSIEQELASQLTLASQPENSNRKEDQ